jgi:hypothetical protein
MITGTIMAGLILIFTYALSGVDLFTLLVNSTFGVGAIWIIGIAIFVLGGFVDSLALMLMDYWLFWRVLLRRPSEVNVDQIVQLAIRLGLLQQQDLTDTKTLRQKLYDLISSVFGSQAPVHLYSKRDELDALYQYNSNMFVLLVLAIPMLPMAIFRLTPGYLYLAVLAVQLILTGFFYRFTLNALARVNSIEDRFVLGYLRARVDEVVSNTSTPTITPNQVPSSSATVSTRGEGVEARLDMPRQAQVAEEPRNTLVQS